uniref:Uncharacterized protein n=1 Tax=Meloidogyne javanica TaxID=6303 RepID=A0A915N335_MELJA
MLIYNLHFVLLILIVPIFRSCSAIPRRGLEPWSIILCKFRDLATYEPRTKNWVVRWITGHNDEPDTIEQYFMNVSNGLYSIGGSNVNGWFTLSKTQKDILHMIGKSRRGRINPPLLGSDSSFRYFDVIKDLCFAEAVKNGSSLHRQKITIINGLTYFSFRVAGTAAVFDKKNGVLLTPQLVFSSVLTHEMVFPYASSGEYDDRYDLMSTANAYMYHSNFGMSGPGLNGPHLDYLGWLPMDRMLYFGRESGNNYTLRLSSISVPHNQTRGWLLIMLPYDRDDPNNYYTIELRTPHNFDRGIEQAKHEILNIYTTNLAFCSGTSSSEKWHKSKRDEQLRLVRLLNGGDFKKQFGRQNFFSNRKTFGANSCRRGFVWRSLDSYDYVCVTEQR